MIRSYLGATLQAYKHKEKWFCWIVTADGTHMWVNDVTLEEVQVQAQAAVDAHLAKKGTTA